MGVRSAGVAASILLVAACTVTTMPPIASPAPVQTLTATMQPTRTPSPIGQTPAPPTTAPTPTTSPTSTPGHTATAPAAATPTPTSSAPTAERGLDQAVIERHLDALADIAAQHGGNRATGTSGYDASAVYVAAELEAMGYAVERQPVEFTYFEETAPVELAVGDQAWTGGEWLHAMVYSETGTVRAGLELVGDIETGTTGCDPAQWGEFDAGNIAVVFGGQCAYLTQVILAQAAGAVAVIGLRSDWGPNQIRRPTLRDPEAVEIPVIAIGSEPSGFVWTAANQGGSARLTVEAAESPVTDDNVIAELPGTSDEVVMLGGHLDSVPDGAGINDNGSGVATILAIAEAVRSDPEPEATIRFAFWAAEEFGVIGSSTYVESLTGRERSSITAYINLDMVASPLLDRIVYDEESEAPGSDEITELLLGALDEVASPGVTADLGGGSDHGPFQRAGIRTGGVFSGVDPCYHLACDDRENVDMSMALDLGNAVLSVVEELAD